MQWWGQGWGGGGVEGGYLDSSFLGIPAGSGLTGGTVVAGGGGAVLGPPLTGRGGAVLSRCLTGLYMITCLHAPCLCQYTACALHTQYDCCWLPLSTIVSVVASVIVITSTIIIKGVHWWVLVVAHSCNVLDGTRTIDLDCNPCSVMSLT